MSVRIFSTALLSLLVCALLGVLLFELLPSGWSIAVAFVGLVVVWIALWTLLTRVLDRFDLELTRFCGRLAMSR